MHIVKGFNADALNCMHYSVKTHLFAHSDVFVFIMKCAMLCAQFHFSTDDKPSLSVRQISQSSC